MMDIIIVVLFLLLGTIIGFISGLLGIGGGFILVPVLIYLFDFMGIPDSISVKMAVGTSLFVIFLTSIAGAHKHSLNKNIVWKCSLYLGFFGILGSFIGVRVVVDYLSGNIHKILFAILLITISLNIFHNTLKNRKLRNLGMDKNMNKNMDGYMDVNKDGDMNMNMNICQNINYRNVSVLGFLIGVISSIFGIGGGIIVVPFLNILLKFPIKSAIGTSLGMMIIVSFAGLLGYMLSPCPYYSVVHNIGYVSLFAGLTITPVAMILSKYGARVSNGIKPDILKTILAVILLIVGVKMIISTVIMP